MKKLNLYITEKFKINSKTVHKTKDIKVKINSNTVFKQEEIDTIKEYVNQFKVVPVVLSNQVFWVDKLYNYTNEIFIYFKDNWNKENQRHYLIIHKDNIDKDNSYVPELCIDDRLSSLKGGDNKTFHGTVAEVCEEFIKQLDDQIYDKLRK